MTTHITLSKVGALSSYGGAEVHTKLLASKTVTPSADAENVDIATPIGGGVFLTVEAGEDVYYAYGPAPDPTQDPRWRLLAGKERTHQVETGDIVAVIAAS